MIRRTPALLITVVLVAVLAVPALAASSSSTEELTAGPPSFGSWAPDPAQTGPRTAADIYGSSGSGVNGFSDAYRRLWRGTDQVLVDRVEHYTSAFWAAFRYGESSGLASGNSGHAAYKKIPSFTSQAYETTDSADAQGFLADTIVFTRGDYLVLVELAAKVSIPHDVLMDQANRQLALIPVPTAEYTQLGFGIILGGGVFLLVLAAVIVGVVLLVRRRRPAIAGRTAFATIAQQPAQGVTLSSDGRHWWDGQGWNDTALSAPPGAPRSPDGGHWWDGQAWRPVPPA